MFVRNRITPENRNNIDNNKETKVITAINKSNRKRRDNNIKLTSKKETIGTANTTSYMV